MAKGKVTFSRSLKSIVKNKLDKGVDRAAIEQIKKFWLNDVKKNLRKGRQGDNKKQLKRVTLDWTRRRAKLYKAGNPMGKGMTPNARISRATFMGDLLDGLKVRYSTKEWRTKRRIKLTMYVEGKHRPVIGVRGRVLKGSNADLRKILRGLEGNGYQVLGYSDRFKQRFKKDMKKMLKQ